MYIHTSTNPGENLSRGISLGSEQIITIRRVGGLDPPGKRHDVFFPTAVVTPRHCRRSLPLTRTHRHQAQARSSRAGLRANGRRHRPGTGSGCALRLGCWRMSLLGTLVEVWAHPPLQQQQQGGDSNRRADPRGRKCKQHSTQLKRDDGTSPPPSARKIRPFMPTPQCELHDTTNTTSCG